PAGRRGVPEVQQLVTGGVCSLLDACPPSLRREPSSATPPLDPGGECGLRPARRPQEPRRSHPRRSSRPRVARLHCRSNTGRLLGLRQPSTRPVTRRRFLLNEETRFMSNPELQESDASQKCLSAYNYDSSMCSAYFHRYKNCRKYWHSVMLQRRRDGVRPDMPTAADRQEMLAAMGGKPY
uniref:Coiled-coil-helix-coiled-coil-helix domain-containing protein 7 n=1 Tax=Gasterosteus aculeatus aculeatus TaxID=481459 RepID=A0AAQ4P4X5_GASAC